MSPQGARGVLPGRRLTCLPVFMPGAASSRTDPVEAARLLLTPVGPEDVNDLVLLYSDPRVAFWTGPWSRESVEAWTQRMTAR